MTRKQRRYEILQSLRQCDRLSPRETILADKIIELEDAVIELQDALCEAQALLKSFSSDKHVKIENEFDEQCVQVPF